MGRLNNRSAHCSPYIYFKQLAYFKSHLYKIVPLERAVWELINIRYSLSISMSNLSFMTSPSNEFYAFIHYL